jgi:hypothetical protein
MAGDEAVGRQQPRTHCTRMVAAGATSCPGPWPPAHGRRLARPKATLHHHDSFHTHHISKVLWLRLHRSPLGQGVPLRAKLHRSEK